MELSLEKVVQAIKKATDNKFEVFKDDVEKEELKELDSFIIYHPYGKLRRAEKGEYSQEFYLIFVTTESINFFEDYVFKLIRELQKLSIIFDESDHDIAKMKNTGDNAELFTMDFHRQLQCAAGIGWTKANG